MLLLFIYAAYFDTTGILGRTFDVSPDGQRFLMIREDAGATSQNLVVILNWFQELLERVPAD